MFAFCLDMPGVTHEFAAMVDEGVGQDPVAGLIAHVSGPCREGWRIVDVWESEADQNRFQTERLSPAVARATAHFAAPPVPFDFRSVTGETELSRHALTAH